MATTKAEEQSRLWTRENIMSVENRILQQVMSSNARGRGVGYRLHAVSQAVRADFR